MPLFWLSERQGVPTCRFHRPVTTLTLPVVCLALMRGLAFIAVALLTLAGCTSPSDTQPTGEVVLQYDDGGANKVDVPRLNATPPLPGERSLEKAPEWRLGEWWDYTITDHFQEKTITVKRVVAGTFGTNYLVGFPLDAFSNDALVLHIPGYGDIDQTDLSFESHDVDTKLLDFPLESGKSWSTAWEGLPGNATITAAADGKATIELEGQNYLWVFEYDAETGEIAKMHNPAYATIEITGHGFGFTGSVRVPHAHDLLFMNGRLGPWDITASPVDNPAPAPATETVEVTGGYDRVGFVIIAGPIATGLTGGFVPGSPGMPGGTFTERATAPDGTVYELTVGPTETVLKAEFFGHEKPVGTWTLEHQAVGAGIVLTEGIGYHSIDIDLPSGCVLPGANANHHLNPCTGQMGA